MENAILFLLVAFAFGYLIHRVLLLIDSFGGKGKGNCGCSHCGDKKRR